MAALAAGAAAALPSLLTSCGSIFCQYFGPYSSSSSSPTLMFLDAAAVVKQWIYTDLRAQVFTYDCNVGHPQQRVETRLCHDVAAAALAFVRNPPGSGLAPLSFGFGIEIICIFRNIH